MLILDEEFACIPEIKIHTCTLALDRFKMIKKVSPLGCPIFQRSDEAGLSFVAECVLSDFMCDFAFHKNLWTMEIRKDLYWR